MEKNTSIQRRYRTRRGANGILRKQLKGKAGASPPPERANTVQTEK